MLESVPVEDGMLVEPTTELLPGATVGEPIGEAGVERLMAPLLPKLMDEILGY